MRGIWELFRSDLKRATSNVMSVIVLCGLIVIPSAFTWFNVIGSWEPFNNTKSLKVAVASVDEGYTSALVPMHLNIGSMVESALRANDQLDWVITSKEDAVAGTESGEYYAAMVLPKDFSERMLTFYTAGSKRTQIDYYTNDKSNPLAPLITSEGADDLSAKINAEFTQELSNIALSIIESLATTLSDSESQATFVRIEAQVGAVSVQLRAASDTASMFTTLIESSVPLVQSAGSLLGTVESEFSSESGKIREGLGGSSEANAALDRATQALAEALNASRDELSRFEADITRIFGDLDAGTTVGVEKINEVADRIGDLVTRHEALRERLVNDVRPKLPEEERPAFDLLIDGLDEVIEQERALETHVRDAATEIAAGNTSAQQAQREIVARIEAAQASLANASNVYENSLKPTFDQLAGQLAQIGTSIDALTGRVASAATVTNDAVEMLEHAARDTAALADALNASADGVDRVQEVLATAVDSGDFSKIATIIGADPSILAAALAQPIGLERIPVFKVVSFGAGMSPLYTALSLWVGALLMSVTLRVEPPTRASEGGPELKLYQQFLGRYAIFALLGLAQSTLVFLGNIFLVQLEPVHPFLFMLVGWSSSLVFTFVIYTLVVSFSDAGKALAVFLLVVQVAGAGGAYPLPLLPEWFQNISPFLPATHSMDAIRSSMAGIYQGDYWVSLGWLYAFVIPMLLLGLALRKPLIGFNKKMEAQLQSTKLM